MLKLSDELLESSETANTDPLTSSLLVRLSFEPFKPLLGAFGRETRGLLRSRFFKILPPAEAKFSTRFWPVRLLRYPGRHFGWQQ